MSSNSKQNGDLDAMRIFFLFFCSSSRSSNFGSSLPAEQRRRESCIGGLAAPARIVVRAVALRVRAHRVTQRDFCLRVTVIVGFASSQ